VGHRTILGGGSTGSAADDRRSDRARTPRLCYEISLRSAQWRAGRELAEKPGDGPVGGRALRKAAGGSTRRAFPVPHTAHFARSAGRKLPLDRRLNGNALGFRQRALALRGRWSLTSHRSGAREPQRHWAVPTWPGGNMMRPRRLPRGAADLPFGAGAGRTTRPPRSIPGPGRYWKRGDPRQGFKYTSGLAHRRGRDSAFGGNATSLNNVGLMYKRSARSAEGHDALQAGLR